MHRPATYDVLLQIPPDMRFETSWRDNVCLIDLVRADERWVKQAGQQGTIDIKYVSRNMKQLPESIEENVQVHHRVQRLRLAWYDPVRQLLFTETNNHQAPLRFAIRDMARCPEWMATRPVVWFSALINDLFQRSFSLWDESILTGKWLRSTMWVDQKRLWSVMNQNWRQLLGSRLLRPTEAHPFTADFEAYERNMLSLQTEILKLRKLRDAGKKGGDEEARRKNKHVDMEKGGELLLQLQRCLITALLQWQDLLDDWHSFIPSFQYQWESTQKFTLQNSLTAEKGSKDSGIRNWATDKISGMVEWLNHGDSGAPSPREEGLPMLDDDDAFLSSMAVSEHIPVVGKAKRPVNRRVAQLEAASAETDEDKSDADRDPESDASEERQRAHPEPEPESDPESDASEASELSEALSDLSDASPAPQSVEESEEEEEEKEKDGEKPKKHKHPSTDKAALNSLSFASGIQHRQHRQYLVLEARLDIALSSRIASDFRRPSSSRAENYLINKVISLASCLSNQILMRITLRTLQLLSENVAKHLLSIRAEECTIGRAPLHFFDPGLVCQYYYGQSSPPFHRARSGCTVARHRYI